MPRHAVSNYPHRFMLGLTEQMYRRIETEANKRGIAQSELIRTAIENHLNESE